MIIILFIIFLRVICLFEELEWVSVPEYAYYLLGIFFIYILFFHKSSQILYRIDQKLFNTRILQALIVQILRIEKKLIQLPKTSVLVIYLVGLFFVTVFLVRWPIPPYVESLSYTYYCFMTCGAVFKMTGLFIFFYFSLYLRLFLLPYLNQTNEIPSIEENISWETTLSNLRFQYLHKFYNNQRVKDCLNTPIKNRLPVYKIPNTGLLRRSVHTGSQILADLKQIAGGSTKFYSASGMVILGVVIPAGVVTYKLGMASFATQIETVKLNNQCQLDKIRLAGQAEVDKIRLEGQAKVSNTLANAMSECQNTWWKKSSTCDFYKSQLDHFKPSK